jgi:histidinol-phosphatase (PHP family)
MLDLHTHTKYSKHAKGEVEEVIKSAISNKVDILCLTDHAPYLVDVNNRILDAELNEYIEEVNRASKTYHDQIRVLVGLEVDYHPDHEDYISDLLQSVNLDYVIGAIHYVYVNGERINVWDIESLSSKEFLDEYFIYLDKMICSGFFDSIAHPDTIMRGGIKSKQFFDRFYPLARKMREYKVSYEINCSSRRKSNYNVESQSKDKGDAVYPNYYLVEALIREGISFTIGSDAHKPEDVGLGIHENLVKCMEVGLEFVTYYESRRPKKLSIKTLAVYRDDIGLA